MQKGILLEINRVREIMGLQEQRIVTDVVDRTEFDVTVPIPRIEGTYQPGDSDPLSFIGEAESIILQSINNTPGAADKFLEGQLQLVDITVNAGASNVWSSKDGATNYDVNNNYKPTESGMESGLDSRGYEKNLKLAKQRASRFIDEITVLLRNNGIDVSEQLSKSPNAVVVDTGGKLDGDRVESEYPNPGQVLFLDLSFNYLDVEEKIQVTCLPEIKISVGVLGVNTDGHDCDEAIFKVTVNGAKLGVANLNNGAFDVFAYKLNSGIPWNQAGWPKNIVGPLQGKYQMAPYLKLPGQNTKKRTTDGKKGGVRTWTTTIDTNDKKYNWGEDNVLEITPLVKVKGGNSEVGGAIVCRKGMYRDRSCGSHSEVPNVVIQNTPESEGQFVTIYDDQPNIQMPIGSTQTTKLLSLDKCGVPIVSSDIAGEDPR
jgi:hypothetical protein